MKSLKLATVAILFDEDHCSQILCCRTFVGSSVCCPVHIDVLYYLLICSRQKMKGKLIKIKTKTLSPYSTTIKLISFNKFHIHVYISSKLNSLLIKALHISHILYVYIFWQNIKYKMYLFHIVPQTMTPAAGTEIYISYI